ncbi:MAG: GEVED domain-containing protein, partial [Bacteroidetes bacterium]|nr:GEVED domain-containing protein [Bacteroidota bacterium]
CNAFGCDTLTKTVTLANVGGPVPASCSPATTAYCCSIGIYSVNFNTIHNNSLDGVDGYKDYTCSASTNIFRGQSYSINITTGPTYTENVMAWIDFNNNGIFESAELVFASAAMLQYHSGTVSIPSTGVVLNTPLRMRIGSDYSGNAAPDPCTPVQYGQFEDYTVYITINVGIDEASVANGFAVFPNPFTNETSIQYDLDVSQKVTLEVYNAIGEKVREVLSDKLQQAGRHVYRLKNLEGGIYFIRLITKEGMAVRRIIRME